MTTTTTFYRPLGRSGIQVSAVGMGCWAAGGNDPNEPASGWHGVEDAETVRAIHRGLDLGINFFDTANVYGGGHSEEILAEALGSHTTEVVIATKFGYGSDEYMLDGTVEIYTPEGIRQSCERSLRRLKRDTIDLLQFHNNEFPVDRAQPVRDTLEALVAEGKIRTYGWSTDFAEAARYFADGPNCTAIQVEMNVIDDSPKITKICEEFDLASINRGPLAMGLLTGKYTVNSSLPLDDVRGTAAPEWMKYFKDGKPNPEWMNKVDAVKEILTSGGRTLAQGAIAWLWGRSEKTIPIPGFKTVAQAEDNAGAMRFGPLTADQVAEIDRILGR
ncbi:MAG: aldo/keto reductase [Chloroflexota bacterium]